MQIGDIIIWDGALSTIPTGWQLYSTGIGKYPRGATTGIGDTGGADTHTHTCPTTGSAGAHSHSASGTVTGGASVTGSGGTSYYATQPSHSHSVSTSGWSTSDVHTHTQGDTSSASLHPPYTKLYYIIKVA